MIMMKEHMHPGVMANTVIPSGDYFNDKNDGDLVDFSGKAKVVEEGGKKVLIVQQVDGNDVEEINPKDHEPMDSEEDKYAHHSSVEDAMQKFFNK